MVAAGLIHKHGVAVVHFAGQQHARQLVADFGLYQTTQWASAIRRVVTGVGEPIARRIGNIQLDAAIRQAGRT